MNLTVPIQDVILALGVTGFALTPWPWSALLFAAGWLIFIALLVDARTPASGDSGPEGDAIAEVKP